MARRPGGRGGRSGARAAAAAAVTPIIAGLERKIPTYEILDDAGLTVLEDAADTILAEVGIDFKDDAEVLRIFADAGAEVNGENVRFPKGMCREIIQKSAQREFTQHARNPARSVHIGGKTTVFAPAYGSPFIRNRDEGRRYANLQDFQNFVKLAQSCQWMHHSGGTICEPVDIPVNKRHLDMVYAHIKFSDRPFMGSVTAGERAEDTVEMAKIVFGADKVDKECCVVSLINVNSPLTYDSVMLGALKAYAKANQAVIVTPFILGGAMGPVTATAGAVQVLAEALAGLSLVQLIRPGAPMIMGAFLSSMSLQSGAPTFGMPEPALAYFAIGQLARRLGVPFRLGGALTGSKISDAQAAQESADTLMPTILAGTNFMLHGAGWLEGGLAMGYEKFMIDCDHLGMMHKLAGGLALDDNGLALDAFREVGPGQHFLGCAHTMANFETAYFDPPLSDNNSFEQWEGDGSKDIIARAHEKWKSTLAAYEAPPLDVAIDEAVQDFIKMRKDSMPDAWH